MMSAATSNSRPVCCSERGWDYSDSWVRSLRCGWGKRGGEPESRGERGRGEVQFNVAFMGTFFSMKNALVC